MKRRVIILGVTGSIGRSTVDIVKRNQDKIEVVGISAHRDSDGLLKAANELGSPKSLLTGVKRPPQGVDLAGREGIFQLLEECKADIVVNAIAGTSGLFSSLIALEAGAKLALANKESMVSAGSLVKKKAEEHDTSIVPIDSELSALYSLLDYHPLDSIDTVYITASGGPFRERALDTFSTITVQEALIHPTWSMGKKITVDSATMANKGLEVLEVSHLFDIPLNKIEVLIHPQSIVHAMVRERDGSLYPNMSAPDMRLPIQNALLEGELRPLKPALIDFSALTLSFLPPEKERYRMLTLAYEAGEAGGSYPAVYNRANELSVELFLEGQIGFLQIRDVVASVLEREWASEPDSFESVREVEERASSLTKEAASSLQQN